MGDFHHCDSYFAIFPTRVAPFYVLKYMCSEVEERQELLAYLSVIHLT